MNARRVFWLVFFGGLLFFATAMVWYTHRVLTPYPPAPAALEALVSDNQVQVQTTSYGWVFIPQGEAKGGLAFYPGGLVEPQAYAPVLRQIAAGGYRVASNFAQSSPDPKALVMWAAYPQNDLSEKNLPTLALFAEHDGVIRREQLEASRSRFPKNTLEQVIPGLNHAGFGAYGPQRGDNPATISAEEGWRQIAQRTIAFLDQHLGAVLQ